MPYGRQLILSKKAGTRHTYGVTLLWLPPHPEDSIPGSFDFRAPIPQAFPNLAPRQISEAIPRNERLNSPETAPAAALEQGPERTQEEGAVGTGPRKSGRTRRPKRPKLRCKQCLGIARLAAVSHSRDDHSFNCRRSDAELGLAAAHSSSSGLAKVLAYGRAPAQCRFNDLGNVVLIVGKMVAGSGAACLTYPRSGHIQV
jgi:hypothetical protein